MYGYVYITENLINDKKYIGKHRAENTDDDGYLGSGTALKKAIKKYGSINFNRQIISIAATREELDVLEIALIVEYDAVENIQFYNLAAGGGGDHRRVSVEQLTNHAAKVRLAWKNMTPEYRAIVRKHLIEWRTPEYRARMSATKTGISNWTPKAIESMVQKRRAQVALGIGVPPIGNRGNKNYRHSETNKAAIKLGVAKARIRISTERDTYHTEEGKIAMLEKLALHYTPEVREDHSKLIREGQARRLADYKTKGIPLPKFHWYHNPNDQTERATFSGDDIIPEGWLKGMGNRSRRVDVAQVHELIAAGRKDADIAREVGCAPSGIWQIRHNLNSK